MPWRGPSYPGELPTLGWHVLEWIEAYLAAPDRAEYEPLLLTAEQARFVLNLYALDPVTGRRRIRRALLSRPKGWGKSPLLGALAAAEALADVVPDGWDAEGEPAGRPWATVRTPLVQIAAVSEDQTANAWAPLLEMLRSGPVLDAYAIDPMDTFVSLPGGGGTGRIEAVTSSPTSREGGRPVFVVLDQTEAWVPSNGGVKLAATLRRNLGKTAGCSVESPNAFVPGELSVAERSTAYAQKIAEGRARDDGLLWDHREAPPETDLADRRSLMAGLAVAYGDSAAPAGGWVDLERIAAEVWDPDTEPQDARRYYLNQVTHASDSWLALPEWAGCTDASKVVSTRDAVVLGFDGSRGRAGRSTSDATALVACRVSDGHLWPVEVWEEPDGPAGRDWRVPTSLVDLAVRQAFRDYRVVGMYADPAGWESYVAGWEASFGGQLRVKATRQNPIEWWMTGGRSAAVVQALGQFHAAVLAGDLTHDGSSVLARHVLNARRRPGRGGVQIAKDHPDSPRKIDAAVAGVLAWQCRLDALAAGAGGTEPQPYMPVRIR
jgi:hypothetical protein